MTDRLNTFEKIMTAHLASAKKLLDTLNMFQKVGHFIVLFAFPFFLWAQDASFPLEDVKVSGSKVSKTVVMDIAGLKDGQPINKAGIEDACRKLGESGIFESVSYSYQPGPKKGYVVTLELGDPKKMIAAAFDIPRVDEEPIWAWLAGQFPTFQHRVPQADEAQHYLAAMVERKLGDKLHGEHLVVKLEQDLTKGRQLLSFQPEHLPRIAQMNFTGQSRLPADELAAILQKVNGNDGYTERHFRLLVDQNLRLAYDQHGMFKAQFPKIQAEEVDQQTVNVTTTIVEGLQYKFADVQLVGEDLPAEEMLKAAQFKKGNIANWTDIQQAVWRTETPLKRKGYLEAVSQPERVLNDSDQTLIVKIQYRKGPLYHFGEVAFVGLNADQEAKARKVWKMQTGDIYDFRYSGEFIQAFGKVADLRSFKVIKPKVEPGAGDHVRNETIVFEPK